MKAALIRQSPLLLLALAWEAVARLGLIDAATLPALSDILVSFWRLAQGDLAWHTLQSLWRGALGFGLAVLIGPALGILIAWYWPARAIAGPLLDCIYPLPKTALLPLFMLWLGLGSPTKVALIFIGCLLPIVVSATNAARGVPTSLLWSARGFGVSRLRLIWEVVVPAALPDMLSGIRTALAIGFILLVTSELIIASNGIGHLIATLSGTGDYAGMFAGVLAIAALGYVADRAFAALSRRLLSWREAGHG